jgi:hypothetical protein
MVKENSHRDSKSQRFIKGNVLEIGWGKVKKVIDVRLSFN